MKLITNSMTSRMAVKSARQGLQQIVEDLTGDEGIALARFWLLQTSDACDICAHRGQPDQATEPALHLVASAGQSQNVDQPATWNRLDGGFHRFPLHSEKIGHIGTTGEPTLVHQNPGKSSLLNRDWLAREGIQSFFGYPLAYQNQIIGVFAVFSRMRLTNRDVRFLQQIADGGVRLLASANDQFETLTQLHQSETHNQQLRQEFEAASGYGALIAHSPAAKKLERQIHMAAAHSMPVLIVGEPGAGKELAARLIHRQGNHVARPFVTLNAFATEFRARFTEFVSKSVCSSSDRAAGTFYIDAIDQAPSDVQTTLVEMLAAATTFSSRIIASTTIDLAAAVEAKLFRHDLYCAISAATIDVPPLRQRVEDLPGLIEFELGVIRGREQRDNLEIDSRSLDALRQYSWPGNVRELQSVIRFASTQTVSGPIQPEHYLTGLEPTVASAGPTAFVREDAMKRRERSNLLTCLKQCDWKVYGPGGAAEKLGIKPTTLMYRLKTLGIRRP